MAERASERESEREREDDREIERETNRQTETETETERARERERQTDRTREERGAGPRHLTSLGCRAKDDSLSLSHTLSHPERSVYIETSGCRFFIILCEREGKRERERKRERETERERERERKRSRSRHSPTASYLTEKTSWCARGRELARERGCVIKRAREKRQLAHTARVIVDPEPLRVSLFPPLPPPPPKPLPDPLFHIRKVLIYHRGASLIRNSSPPRTIIGPWAQAYGGVL